MRGQAGASKKGGSGEKDRQYRKFSQRIRFPGVVAEGITHYGDFRCNCATSWKIKLENNVQHKLVDYVDNVSHVFYAAKRRRISAPSYPK
ncbi:hypothetical protein [Rhizobium croatiense]|uniref:hypothetical protein n=1 Tax=Rhizobium croatiense TaxID=2867516 RepID=UPI0023ECEB01|nr:hypothetical protein [Rhizobium croatiense]WET72549.1 hypothetical protein PYR68_13765 [Rhizobium croatiense]